MNYDCPSCGVPLNFKSSVSIFTTCTHCKSTVIRNDMDLELIGKQSALIRDMSPFQVGTRGKYNGKGFELLGRIKVMYDKGSWSEWYFLYDDGTPGWLSEAQGNYMISEEAELEDAPQSPKEIKVGDTFTIKGDKYVVEDKQKIKYAASEGELPFVFHQDYKGTSIDLRGPKGKFAGLLYDEEGTQVFTGHYLAFSSFEFQNLNDLDGW